MREQGRMTRTNGLKNKGSNVIFWLSLIAGFSLVLLSPRLDVTFGGRNERNNSAFTVVGHQTLRVKKENPSICMHLGLPSEVDKCLLLDPPSDFMKVLTQVLIGLPNAGECVQERGCTPPHAPYRPFMRHYGQGWPPYGYTMIGRERMDNFRSAIAEVNRNNIPGAIVETGFWRGGAMIMAAAAVRESGIERDLYLFNAFDMIQNYDDNKGFLQVKEEDVAKAFKDFDLDSSRVHMVKGLFRDTMPLWTDRDDPVAVLRVDGNFYDSYQDVMYALYENVPVGGIVIFNDFMSRPPVQVFWADFVKDHGLVEKINQIDFHSAWFRQVKKVSINQSKKKPAKDANIQS